MTPQASESSRGWRGGKQRLDLRFLPSQMPAGRILWVILVDHEQKGFAGAVAVAGVVVVVVVLVVLVL